MAAFTSRFCCLYFVVALHLFSPSKAVNDDEDLMVDNANHIFNAIHSSMRQWGSSLNHNGMSVFLATVPRNTQLYHGTGLRTAVDGPEWLAFESQHAMQFARLQFSPFPVPPNVDFPDEHDQSPKGSHVQVPLPHPKKIEPPDFNWWAPGFFHTYVAKHDLRLLYLDGSSAAKTDKGTLDLTDMLLLNKTIDVQDEWQRARSLCELAEADWGGLIEGFIRMEAGFEIIMCSFNRSLQLVDVKTAPDVDLLSPTVNEPVYHWLRAAAARYESIGGSPRRVELNYDRFITVYASQLDLFQNDTLRWPRLNLVGADKLDSLRQDIQDLIIQTESTDHVQAKGVDWQAVTDEVVHKYTDLFPFLVHLARTTGSSIRLARELTFRLREYIDNSHRDQHLELQRCTLDLLPHRSFGATNGETSTPLAYRAVQTVTQKICSVLIDALWSMPNAHTPLAGDVAPTEQVVAFNTMVDYLGWTTWKRCGPCAYGEICKIPMFPFGTYKEYDRPQCKSVFDDGWTNIEYWVT